MKRSVLILIVVLLGLMPASPAFAGGWAIVELTKPVPAAIVGEPVTIQFRVMQHAVSPADGLHPVVTLRHRESGERTSVAALATREDPETYEATFTPAETGAYKWNIAADPFPATALPTLTVYASAAEAARANSAQADGTAAAVKILEGAYSPARLVVVPGTTVEWTNTSVIPHQVVWTSLELDDSVILQTDETMRVTFDREGTYTYYCGPHPFMTGEIVVEEASALPGA